MKIDPEAVTELTNILIKKDSEILRLQKIADEWAVKCDGLRERIKELEHELKLKQGFLEGDAKQYGEFRRKIESLEALLDEQNTIIELAKKLVDPNNKNDYENFICLEKAFQKLNSVKGK